LFWNPQVLAMLENEFFEREEIFKHINVQHPCSRKGKTQSKHENVILYSSKLHDDNGYSENNARKKSH
jgi:hypothetical protein